MVSRAPGTNSCTDICGTLKAALLIYGMKVQIHISEKQILMKNSGKVLQTGETHTKKQCQHWLWL